MRGVIVRVGRVAVMVASEASWVLFLPVFEKVRDMSKRCSQEFKDRVVRMVADRLADDSSCRQWRAFSKIAPRLGVSVELMRCWYEQSLIDTGQRPGVAHEEREEIKRLKRENAQLRRTNEILKLASAFFATQLDHPGSK